MKDIHVKTTQDDIIIAHQAKKIAYLEMRLAQLAQENERLKAELSAPAGKKDG